MGKKKLLKASEGPAYQTKEGKKLVKERVLIYFLNERT